MFFGLGVKVLPPAAARSWMTAARGRSPSHVLDLGQQQPGAGPRVAGARPRGRGLELSLGRAGEVARGSLGRRGVGARACARA